MCMYMYVCMYVYIYIYIYIYIYTYRSAAAQGGQWLRVGKERRCRDVVAAAHS